MSMAVGTDLPIAWVFATALSLSFLGSVHCAGMCGGLVAISTRTRVDFARYQAGRLVGYLALGAILGGAGETILRRASWPMTVAFLMLLATLLIRHLWRTRLQAMSVVGSRMGQRLSALIRMNASPEWVGLGSAFLPCGWLWTACLAAAATGSTVRGATYLAGFWLGSTPALGWAPVMLRWLPRSASRPLAALTIALGFASLGMHARGLRWPGNQQGTPVPASTPDAELHTDTLTKPAPPHSQETCH